jgi:pimeloyl-ACP methyl ester carboxylesterase
MRVQRWLSILAGVMLALTGAPAGASDRTGALSWGPCAGLDHPRLRCSTVRVPLDYTRPHGPAIEIAVSRLPATDPALRHGVLLTTGGGPGGPGVSRPADFASVLDPAVLARYDLIGFDMRFVERSTPISCGQAEEEAGGFWVRTAGVRPFGDDVAEAKRYAVRCARTAGWALPYATTANAARDMDRIRVALGERTISYWGSSYAGLLGATYSTLFPARVDRLLLDSPVDGDTVWRDFEVNRTPEFEHNYDTFADVVAADDATYRFGRTRAEVKAGFDELLRTGAVAGGEQWTRDELGYYLVLAVMVDALRPAVALDLASIRDGAPPPVPFPVRAGAAVEGVPPDNHTAVNMAFRCGDNAWPRNPARYRADVAVYSARYPSFGSSNADITPCAFWPAARDNRVPLAGNRASGALILASLGDASVPLRNSQAVRAAIRGSRLVTVDREYHAPFPYAGETCLNDAATAYLVTGDLPATDRAC